MKDNQRLKFFLVLLLMIVMPLSVHAKTLQDMYDKLADLQVKYNNNNKNKNLTEGEIKKLNNEIYTISATIEKGRKEIKQAENDIEKSKTEIENKKVETDGLIQFFTSFKWWKYLFRISF